MATDVEDRLRTICGHLNALHGELVALTAEAIATGCWAQTGVRSPVHWLIWKAGLAPHHARDVVRLAEAVDTHPTVNGCLASGLLTLDQAATAVKAPAYLEATIAEQAQEATVPQLRLLVAGANNDGTTHPGPDGEVEAPSPASPEPEDLVSWWFDEAGRFHLRGELTTDHGRILEQALTEARDQLFHDGQPDVTWADALVELAHRSLDGAPAERRERFRANWFVDPTDPTPARWTDGTPVPQWLVDLLSCDGTVSPVFVANGRPVTVAPTVRTIPDRTRRLVLHRDRTCRAPGCAETRWLQVHHIVHREHGGGHDLGNLLTLCGHHHRQHHTGRLGISGDADRPGGVTFTDRDGRVLTSAARPIPPTGPPPDPATSYRHPLGERLERWAVVYPDPPPAA